MGHGERHAAAVRRAARRHHPARSPRDGERLKRARRSTRRPSTTGPSARGLVWRWSPSRIRGSPRASRTPTASTSPPSRRSSTPTRKVWQARRLPRLPLAVPGRSDGGAGGALQAGLERDQLHLWPPARPDLVPHAPAQGPRRARVRRQGPDDIREPHLVGAQDGHKPPRPRAHRGGAVQGRRLSGASATGLQQGRAAAAADGGSLRGAPRDEALHQRQDRPRVGRRLVPRLCEGRARARDGARLWQVDWKDAEAAQLAEVLPLCKSLRTLRVDANSIRTRGCARWRRS